MAENENNNEIPVLTLSYAYVWLLFGDRGNNGLFNQMPEFNQRYPVKAAIQLKRIRRMLAMEWESLNEQRIELIKQWGTPDKDNPESMEVKPNTKNHSEFMKQWGEVLSQTFDLQVKPLKIEDFGEKAEFSQLFLDAIEHISDV